MSILKNENSSKDVWMEKKYAKAVFFIIMMSAGAVLTMVFGAMSIMCATITLTLSGFTIHTYLEYSSEPKGQRNRNILVPVAVYMGYTLFFAAITVYMVSKWVATL